MYKGVPWKECNLYTSYGRGKIKVLGPTDRREGIASGRREGTLFLRIDLDHLLSTSGRSNPPTRARKEARGGITSWIGEETGTQSNIFHYKVICGESTIPIVELELKEREEKEKSHLTMLNPT